MAYKYCGSFSTKMRYSSKSLRVSGGRCRLLRTSSSVTLRRGVTGWWLACGVKGPRRVAPLQLRTLLAAGGGLHSRTGKVKRARRVSKIGGEGEEKDMVTGER